MSAFSGMLLKLECVPSAGRLRRMYLMDTITLSSRQAMMALQIPHVFTLHIAAL